MYNPQIFSWPLLAAALCVTGPVAAQQTTPCLYLVETVEQRALKIHEAQTRVSTILETGAADRRDAKACRAARDAVADADELAKFAQERMERCETAREKDLLRAAIALGSASIARSLAQALCGN